MDRMDSVVFHMKVMNIFCKKYIKMEKEIKNRILSIDIK